MTRSSTEAQKLPATVYLNGRWLPAAEAQVSAEDHGVLFGLGFYETFRTSGGRPHHWPYHRRRIEQACAVAGIKLPADFLAVDERRLAGVVRESLDRAGCADAVFRYTVTAGLLDRKVVPDLRAGRSGNDALYARPTELLASRLLPPPPAAEGICLRVLNVPRDNGEWLPRPKSLNCANAMLGAAELRRRTADPGDEGLFLSRDDDPLVVETIRQNIAWIRDGRLCYPDLSLGPIAGTCLAWMLELGGPAEPRATRLEELLKAEAVMVMNSVRGITPVREIRGQRDEILIASLASHEHPLVVSLRRQWSEALEATAQTAA